MSEGCHYLEVIVSDKVRVRKRMSLFSGSLTRTRLTFSTLHLRPIQIHAPSIRKMGKNNKRPPPPAEQNLLLPPHHTSATGTTSSTPPSIVDTHTHVAATFDFYKRKYKQRAHADCFDFVRAMCKDRNVDAIVDVWCEAPVQQSWKELANSALTDDDRARIWGGIQYWFVMGTTLTQYLGQSRS